MTTLTLLSLALAACSGDAGTGPSDSIDGATVDVEVYTGACGETVAIDLGPGVPAIVSAYSCPSEDGARCSAEPVYMTSDGVYMLDCDGDAGRTYTATVLIAL